MNSRKNGKLWKWGNTVGDRTFYEAHFHQLNAAKLEAAGYGVRRTEHHFELASVSRKLVEKFSRRTELIEQRARDKYKVLEAQARALMKSTDMAFDDAFAHVIAEIGGDWDRWKSQLGARHRESKSSAKYKVRQELVTHWQSEMTPKEQESLRPERVKSAPSRNLLDACAAKELAVRHLFEQVSLRRELHVAGMLLRRGIARVSIAEALAWVKSDPILFGLVPTGNTYHSRGARRGKQNDPPGGRRPRQTRAAGRRKRVGYSQSPCRRQRGTDQGGSPRSWLKGFRDLFQGTSRSGKNRITD